LVEKDRISALKGSEIKVNALDVVLSSKYIHGCSLIPLQIIYYSLAFLIFAKHKKWGTGNQILLYSFCFIVIWPLYNLCTLLHLS